MSLKNQQKSFLKIAKISSPFKFSGLLKVIYFNEDLSEVFKYKSIYISSKKFERLDFQFSLLGKYLLLKLKDVDSLEKAKLYSNQFIEITKDQLNEDVCYLFELEGMKVIDKEGNPLGKVDKVLIYGKRNILKVNGIKEYLIPLILGVHVKKIHKEKNLIELSWKEQEY